MQLSSSAKKWITVGIVVVLLGLWGITAYNGFVGLSVQVDANWAKVETQYQRRVDLIPNLSETVKGILRQEQDVFGEIARARANYAGAATTNDRVDAANKMESAFSRLLVIMENYPQLQSSSVVRDFMTQLEGTENRISVARNDYNDAVQQFNTAIKRVPGNLVANLFGYGTERTLFKAEAGAEKAPKVDLKIK